MGFWNKIDNRIKSYLEKQIERQDQIQAERESKIKVSKPSKVKQTYNSQEKKLDYSKITDIGLYFMELHDNFKKYGESENRDYILEFYWVLGCASQGRSDEVSEILKDAKNNDQSFYEKIQPFETQILRMTKISQKIDESDMNDLKNGESIGEYQSRKLLKSKIFMKDFDFFNRLEITDIFNCENIKNAPQHRI
ncbi:MAG: hypothetical protein ACKVIG_15470 [Flavobacteriales bacterium]